MMSDKEERRIRMNNREGTLVKSSLIGGYSITRVILTVVLLIATCYFSGSTAVQQQQQHDQLLERQHHHHQHNHHHHNQNQIIPKLSTNQHQQQKNATLIINIQPDNLVPVSSPSPSSLFSHTSSTIAATTTTAATTSASAFLSSSSSSLSPQPSSSSSTTTAARDMSATSTPTELPPTTLSSTTREHESANQKHLGQRRLMPVNISSNKLSKQQQWLPGEKQQSSRSDDGTRQAPSAYREPIDQMSTSQSVSFADPAMAASSNNNHHHQNHQERQEQEQQQKQQHKSSGGNRWTHFGARLRPLNSPAFTGSGDHHEAASNSKSFSAIGLQVSGSSSGNGNGFNTNSNNKMQLRSSPSIGTRQPLAPLNGNQVSGDIGEDNEDLDDDQDSEALLYKMMQQQSFLMSPVWQDAISSSKNSLLAQTAADGGADSAAGGNSNQLAANSLTANSNGNRNNAIGVGNSKRVIKLLKSYSHIHQVDDSDDQIRGTYTRLPARRPSYDNSRDRSWQRGASTANGRQQQQRNKNRSNSNKQQSSTQSRQQPSQHIFVSSQPLTRAYPNERQLHPTGAQSSPQNGGDSSADYPQGTANNQIYGDGSDNGPANGDDSNGGGDGPPPGEEEDEFECPNNGIFADEPSGCQSYHVCQSGAQVQQKFQCPMGTLFNNIILTCDFAHNVQCNGKTKHATTVRPQEQHESLYQQQPQQQQQQVPRASIQANQGSYAQPLPPQQQQTRWSQPQPQQAQQNGQGPRHLKIGQSQYNQHNQQHRQQSPQAQAVGTYPPSPPQHSSSSQPPPTSSNDDDSDDEPIAPLVPATLPPRASPLPYNAPPPPPPPTAPSAHHQSAHRSQYPNHQQAINSYQNNDYPMISGQNYDGASAATPVFASRDEPRATEATSGQQQYSGSTDQNLSSITHSTAPSAPDTPTSFNLVINHVAPTRQHQQQSQQQQYKSTTSKQQAAVGQDFNPKKFNSNHHAKQNQLVTANLPSQHKSHKEAKKQQQQYVITSNNKVPNGNYNQQVASLSNNRDDFLKRKQQQIASYANGAAYDDQRQQLATQPKSVHVDQHQQQPQATLVDLTNDRRTGVSSEAMNDGLLLIVRHSSASNPTQVGIGNGQDRSLSDYKLVASGKRPVAAKQPQAQASTGQAYAVDPAIVRPNSPVDAQLFPNVQKVLAAQSSQPSVSHQAAQSSQYVQHVSLSASSAVADHLPHQTQGGIRVSPPLPPMEPPKPTVDATSGDYTSGSDRSGSELQTVASSSSSSAATITRKGQNKKVSQQQPRVKRTKRLKAAHSQVQSPTSSQISQASDARTTPITTAATTTPVQKQHKAQQLRLVASDQAATAQTVPVVNQQQSRLVETTSNTSSNIGK